MKIGIDAGAIGIHDNRLRLGVYWVNVHLLRELANIDSDNTYYLYSFSPIDQAIMNDLAPTMQNKVLTPREGWFSLRLPLELMLNPVDVFLGLSQGVPPSRSRNIGFVYDLGFLHNPQAYGGSQRKLRDMTNNLMRRSNNIVTISEVVKQDLMKKYSVDSNMITVAYPGVADSFHEKGTKHQGSKPYFLFVGALKPGKNVPLILKGFAEFLGTQKKVYDLYLAGSDYWKDPDIDMQIKKLHLKDRVKKLGYVPDGDLAAYYRGAVSFVSPSLYEGFCLPAVESMASGCPVIGSTAGAFPEIIGESGILVDPKDIHGLAQAMDTMARDRKKRQWYRENGLINVKRYTWKKFAQEVYGIIKSYE